MGKKGESKRGGDKANNPLPSSTSLLFQLLVTPGWEARQMLFVAEWIIQVHNFTSNKLKKKKTQCLQIWYLKLTGKLLNLPGANPAVAGLPMDGWEKTWEKADIFDWDTLLSLEVDPPLGINSLAVGFGVYLKIKYRKLTHFRPPKDIWPY